MGTKLLENTYCIIMAGGVGTRFWPISREAKPKQFLDIFGAGKTLLQQTFERSLKICQKKNIFIVTNQRYAKLVRSQIKDFPEKNLLLEPVGRNTAPCIAYANSHIQELNPRAVIITLPSDHLIFNEPEFINTIKIGLNFVVHKDVLLTLGIKPTKPETGYGYIQIKNNKDHLGITNLRKVKTFTEKPNYELAKVFFKSGEFYWNSGIFIWALKAINKAFEKYLPEVYSMFTQRKQYFNTKKEKDFIKKIYSRCRNISIDYGIMEKANNVYVLCSNFGWSDLGTWSALYENSKQKDENQNLVRGKNIMVYDTKNCIIKFPDNKLTVIQGMEDYIIVESDNILLICKLDDEQKIRQFVNDIKLEKGEKFI